MPILTLRPKNFALVAKINKTYSWNFSLICFPAAIPDCVRADLGTLAFAVKLDLISWQMYLSAHFSEVVSVPSSYEMPFITYVLVFWSVIAKVVRCQGGLPTINTPLSCRAPLPIEWFINNMQSGSNLPSSTNTSLAAASKNLSSYVESLFTTGDTISVVVGTPWGPISELNFGNLRSNATGYNQTVTSQSLYRVASTTKVRSLSFPHSLTW